VAKKKKNPPAEMSHQNTAVFIDRSFNTINTLIKFAALSFIAYVFYLSVDTLAGRQTLANINIAMLLDSRALATIFGAGGIVYGWNQRRLRQKSVKQFQPRIQKLEQLLDSDRSTSSLTAAGETNPDDA